MRADARPRRARPSLLFVGLLVGVIVFAWLGVNPAWSADPRLERARADREAAQAKLDDLLQRVAAVEAELSTAEAQLNSLNRAEAEQERAAKAALGALSQRVVAAYKHGSVDPTLALLSSGSPQEATEQAKMLSLLAKRNRAQLETASSARIRTHATASQASRATKVLQARKVELGKLRQRVATELAEAEQVENQVAAQRTALERPTRSRRGVGGGGGLALPPTLVRGSIACPVDTPHSYSDTYGAPRSGGRRHRGVDILAPRGTPIYTYENGTITRMGTNRLGGITLYLRGDSGNLYYYAHLAGYVSGIRPGTGMRAGQHIAFIGATGNARGIPHLHFEVRRGGGGNVNPYPYARRACA